MRKAWFIAVHLALVIVLSVLLGGCSRLNVGHLSRNPWVVSEPQQMESMFWTFSYTVVPMNDRFGVIGKAMPDVEKLPQDADWLRDLWLAAYLSDEKGNVVAQDIRIFVPRKLDKANGIPFEFFLKPEVLESGTLYISFGYRMRLAATKHGDTDLPFFASETAVTKL